MPPRLGDYEVVEIDSWGCDPTEAQLELLDATIALTAHEVVVEYTGANTQTYIATFSH